MVHSKSDLFRYWSLHCKSEDGPNAFLQCYATVRYNQWQWFFQVSCEKWWAITGSDGLQILGFRWAPNKDRLRFMIAPQTSLGHTQIWHFWLFWSLTMIQTGCGYNMCVDKHMIKIWEVAEHDILKHNGWKESRTAWSTLIYVNLQRRRGPWDLPPALILWKMEAWSDMLLVSSQLVFSFLMFFLSVLS